MEKGEILAKQRLISVSFTLIFNKSENIWNNIYQLEGDLSDFFAANGLEAESVASIEGSGSNRIIMVKKIEEAQVLDNKRHIGGANFPANLVPGKAQKSASIIKNLTNSIGKGRK